MKCAQKGFTLIEIMIVVAIIAILAAIAIPNFISYRKTSQMNACKANMKAIVAACEAYTMKNGELTAAPALSDLTDPTKGAFLKSVPKCPIANSGNYTLILTNGIFGVTCPNASADAAYPHEM